MALDGLKLNLPSGAITALRDTLYVPPVADARSLFFLGQSLAFSRKNRIYGGRDAAVIGAPTIEDNYALIDGQNAYLDTLEPDAAAMTIVAVAQATANAVDTASSAYFYGTAGGDGSAGVNLYFAPGTIKIEANYRDASSAAKVIASGTSATASPAFGASPFPWRCFIGKVAATATTMKDMTLGTSDTDAVDPSYTRKLNTKSMTIGSRATSAAGGDFNGAALMRVDRATTDDEDAAIYAWLKAIYADLGITI